MELAAIPTENRTCLVYPIDSITENPYAGNALKSGLRGLRRLRVGVYQGTCTRSLQAWRLLS